MSTKSWHLSRRTFLQGSGVAMALPFLDSMADAADAQDLPRRFCSVYFPFGVSLPPEKHEQAEWNWFPEGGGSDFRFRNVLRSLEPLKQDVTVLGGISHPSGHKMGGHDTGDIFLTGARFHGSDFSNSISLDQYAALETGNQTRFPSMVLSSDGGVGEPTRSTTLSFSREGRPVPALASPKQIFSRLFGDGDNDTATEQRQLENSGSILDLVLENARSLKNRLGRQDQNKFDEYLSSVRDIEQRVQRSQHWLDIPKPEVPAGAVNIEVSQDAPREYLQSMYDLMFLAFQTDSTRLATYMIGQVAGATTIANAFPACIGLQGNWHGLAHGAGKKGGYERLGRFDQFLAEHLASFLEKLASTPEGDGTLLDRTIILYGSSNSRTHNNRNYPLVLAGGRGLGLKHGQYLRYKDDLPLANLFVTILHRLGIESPSFADSSGELTDII
ncbi:MAG: DUF1552 domain-containing protein [Pirellulaceae bacterium]|nr:DUF1552 domain-containing protein [Pirellulaceae bacterium]